MKKIIKRFRNIIVLAAIVMVSITPNLYAKNNRKTISLAERAVAVLEIQNVMSKHAYYHQIGQHCEEIEDIWVSENGEYGKNATWTSSSGVEEGIALIKNNYCILNQESQKKALEKMSKILPEIENIPENIGIGGEYATHTQSTPIIEIAGDGKTAKGLWYSIGYITRGSVVDGKVTQSGNWMWEKYAVDFAKENGEWKIWHLMNVGDVGPTMDDEITPPEEGANKGERADKGPPGGAVFSSPGMGREVTRENPDSYDMWKPTVVPRIYPPFPEPYYTFSETFSY